MRTSFESFTRFFDNLIQNGLEHFKLYYGIYRAVVTKVDDQNRGRVKIKVPSITGDTELSSWALPNLPFAGNGYGAHWLPQEKDFIWVMFEGGRVSNPVWMGGWYAEREMPPDMTGKAQKMFGVQTPAGHQVMVDEEDGVIRIVGKGSDGKDTIMTILAEEHGFLVQTPAGDSGNTIYLSEDGVLLASKDGHWVSMNDNGITLTAQDSIVNLDGKNVVVSTSGNMTLKAGKTLHIDAGTVLVGGDKEQLVKGSTLVKWLQAHTHLCSAPSSPSGTPVPPAIDSLLLHQNVKSG